MQPLSREKVVEKRKSLIAVKTNISKLLSRKESLARRRAKRMRRGGFERLRNWKTKRLKVKRCRVTQATHSVQSMENIKNISV